MKDSFYHPIICAKEILPYQSVTYLWGYGYDQRSQLLGVGRLKDGSTYWQQTFAYDLNGNLLRQQETGQAAQVFSHSGDVLTQVDSKTLDSDDNGQMQETLSATDVDWNWEGKIRSVTRPDGTVISYKYDDMGNRVWKEVDDGQSTTETRFLWMTPGDLPVLLAEVDATTDNILRSYIHVNTQPVVLFDGDMTDSLTDKYFYLSDRLGSVRLIVDESAGVSHHYAYKPFGQTDDAESDSDQSAPYNPLMFTGQYYDVDPNLYYLRARHYAPELFGFLSFDPVRGLKQEPLTLHRYLYTANDPINRVDPSGEFLSFVNLLLSTAEQLQRRSREGATGAMAMNFASKVMLKISQQILMLNVRINYLFYGGAAGASGGSTYARLAGRLGETRAQSLLGFAKNTTRITVPGTSRSRIPDGIVGNNLFEVKNVAKLTNTEQIRDMMAIAKNAGGQLTVIVRQNTTIAPKLKQWAEEGKLIIEKIL